MKEETEQLLTNRKKWTRKQKIYVVLLCVMSLTAFLMLISFEYEDLDSITAWSLNFWDLLFKGKLDEFYQYAGMNARGAAHTNCAGNWLWLLPVCIWNFPLWIVHMVSGTISVHHFFSLCWTKMFWLLLQVVTAYVCRKICILLTSDSRKGALVFLLVMASPEVMMSVGYAGQDEIVYICLFVMALNFFLENKWRRSYLLMVLCVTICPIMLLPCAVLILIKEKHIIKILCYAAGSIVPLVIFEWFYRADAIYQFVKTDNDFLEMAYSMLNGVIVNTGMGSISVSVILLVAIYFLCYGIKKGNEEKFDLYVIYMVSVSFCVICFLMPHHFYRMFLYVPVLIIQLFVSNQNMNMNLFLLTVVTYGRTLQACWISFPQNLETMYVMQHSWVTRLCDFFGSSKYKQENSECLWAYITDYLGGRASMPVEFSKLIISTCTLIVMIILLVINHPRQKKCYRIACPFCLSMVAYVMCMPLFLMMFYAVLLQSG